MGEHFTLPKKDLKRVLRETFERNMPQSGCFNCIEQGSPLKNNVEFLINELADKGTRETFIKLLTLFGAINSTSYVKINGRMRKIRKTGSGTMEAIQNNLEKLNIELKDWETDLVKREEVNGEIIYFFDVGKIDECVDFRSFCKIIDLL